MVENGGGRITTFASDAPASGTSDGGVIRPYGGLISFTKSIAREPPERTCC